MSIREASLRHRRRWRRCGATITTMTQDTVPTPAMDGYGQDPAKHPEVTKEPEEPPVEAGDLEQ